MSLSTKVLTARVKCFKKHKTLNQKKSYPRYFQIHVKNSSNYGTSEDSDKCSSGNKTFYGKRPLRILQLPNLMVTICNNSQRPQISTFSDDINPIGHLQQKQLLKSSAKNSGNFFVNRKNLHQSQKLKKIINLIISFYIV